MKIKILFLSSITKFNYSILKNIYRHHSLINVNYILQYN
ncbi:hypothetical protein A1OE_312 [Candidatus Endolissoclinum faulkneri L2]|uniref:Uncharacterized protein n=1 Tax=Candidatus Endolissoclinum faulkneri L2 TaxID=1193729 RepID=K7YFZ3_9PROT|nr:hypothetical protein A1OE_312 [Candidatus Endolissoclinum faulkneri L2]